MKKYGIQAEVIIDAENHKQAENIFIDFIRLSKEPCLSNSEKLGVLEESNAEIAFYNDKEFHENLSNGGIRVFHFKGDMEKVPGILVADIEDNDIRDYITFIQKQRFEKVDFHKICKALTELYSRKQKRSELTLSDRYLADSIIYMENDMLFHVDMGLVSKYLETLLQYR